MDSRRFVILIAISMAAFVAGILSVRAGITIHFEGSAGSPAKVLQIIETAKSFAKGKEWRVVEASSPNGVLERVIDEKNRDYRGRITGITIYPSPKCEPINIQFGDDLFIQDFVKTQFAGAGVHQDVIALFDVLKPHFEKLEIVDEGDYWDSRDPKVLKDHISKINEVMEDMKQKNSDIKGPVFLPSGRIIDVTE